VNLRNRVALAAGVTSGVCLLLVAVAIFVLERADLRRSVDQELMEQAEAVTAAIRADGRIYDAIHPPPLQIQTVYAQRLAPDGSTTPLVTDDPVLAVSDQALAVARGEEGRVFEDQFVAGSHVRVLTTPVAGGALQFAHPLEMTDVHLGHLVGLLAAGLVAGVAVAALVAHHIAKTVVRPVGSLADAAEEISGPWVPGHRLTLTDGGDADLRRLSESLNALLEARDDALRSQQRLVADAAHELLTPLTSVRANLQLLQGAQEGTRREHVELVTGVAVELDELTSLVRDLLELARLPDEAVDPEPVALDDLCGECVDWCRRRHPDLRVELDLESVMVEGRRSQLAHLVTNLLENAARWSPPGTTVEVRLREDALIVTDDGPGFAEEDLPHVFERFYRAESSRGTVGSGLGLAIVRRVAEQHGWSVRAGNAPAGGGRVTIELLPHFSAGVHERLSTRW
jgi:two-component system sensor histidine kinase MprB